MAAYRSRQVPILGLDSPSRFGSSNVRRAASGQERFSAFSVLAPLFEAARGYVAHVTDSIAGPHCFWIAHKLSLSRNGHEEWVDSGIRAKSDGVGVSVFNTISVPRCGFITSDERYFS
jgi:hypothetical protein